MSENKQIFLYNKGTISRADKAALKAAGYLPIECSDINSVALLFPGIERLKGDDIFQAAIQSITLPAAGAARERFAANIIKAATQKKSQ